MSRKLILASTITMVLAGTDVSALGLGGLRPQSALNQPFVGEIELRDVRADELDSVSASLGSQVAFSKAGIERYYYLTRLQFTPDINAQGKPVVRISSTDPIREPYMDFLVEVVWPSGKLLKEYTVLLDPPGMSQRTASPSVRAARAGSAAAGADRAASVAASSGRSNYISGPGDGFPVYVGPVGNGNGLWVLARSQAPAGATVAQTAMALYRNNQNAFIRGNINRLIAGKTLVIPSKAELFALDPATAEREYAAALRGRAQYRAPLTDVSQAMAASQLRVTGATQPTAAAAAAAPAAGTQAPPPTTSPKVQQDVMLALETSESTRQETVELRDRIRELETQLADIQTLLQLRNAELSRLQDVKDVPGTLGEPRPPVATETVTTETVSAEQLPTEGEATLEPVVEEVATEEVAVVPEEAGVEPALEEAVEVAETAGEALDAALAEEEESVSEELGLIPVPTPTEPLVVEETAEAVVEPPQPPAADQLPTPVAEQEESSTWHALLLPLAGLAGLTAVGIMVFSWITMRRRREEEEAFDEDEIGLEDARDDTLDVTTEPRSSVVGDDDETIAATSRAANEPLSEQASLQTNEGDGESGVTMMSSLSNFDAETDEADVLSEADIYIAYGRYSEAQDLLKNELGRFPERLDIKYKLAEAFAASRDLNSLAAIMEEIQSAGGDQQDAAQWNKLQSQREQLQSSGGAGAVPVAPTPGKELSWGREDSLDLGLEDSLSLDLSDVQGSSGQDDDSSDLLDELEFEQEGESDQASGAKRAVIDVGLDDSELDIDAFGDAMTVAVNQADKDQHDTGADTDDTEIELSLEEHRVEDVDDLDSIFDTETIDEPTLARDEMEGARPKDVDLGLLGQSTSGSSESSGPGLPPDQESVPSDLLSSQWQIDSGIWDETATKLDLARAYIEMDDKEAAREILQEVMSEGRDEQKGEAKSMLEGLG
ncbi:hypothetical protein G3480_09510 [Thiorhodococcus mannitoliphagus]|uniref:FimV N-terminal domain-containing protein n=1 Tax=Thiorhodococcus mannitoliphagus TaxID=329406 RepID=A0A6P1DXV3_9GAMM|nr:FimV/HubP family polar landmark protein [Thiorhodococcus mannitoliphagus]NEX20544.1 hypothetical protein [Thiorhodococcus mannitoliphagus]